MRKIYVSLAKAKLSPSESLSFALQNTVFCKAKDISFTIQTFQLFNLSTFQLLKDISFTRLKRKKIPTEFVKKFRQDLSFINIRFYSILVSPCSRGVQLSIVTGKVSTLRSSAVTLSRTTQAWRLTGCDGSKMKLPML